MRSLGYGWLALAHAACRHGWRLACCGPACCCSQLWPLPRVPPRYTFLILYKYRLIYSYFYVVFLYACRRLVGLSVVVI